MEMQYRGGRYKGRCQGGLPEGKVNSYKSIISKQSLVQLDSGMLVYLFIF